ncbi:MAG TPA: 1,4-beta-xylanase [bacterium]|nr:1,4-beta-xylanase [bacterium]
MKATFLFVLTLYAGWMIPAVRAQDSVAAKLTPSAIEGRIREIRMGEIVVRTRPGAEVEVRQTRHEFLFGTAVPNPLAENDADAMSPEDRKQFIEILSENFNYAVHENALKWYDCEKEPGVVDYTTADRLWEICHELDIPMRGHCIFWEKEEFLMPWLKELNNDDLRAAVARRGIGVTGHFRGRIHEFDLNNEMIHGDFFRRRLGWGVINEMAWLARAGNPDAVLYVNDYGILVDGGVNASAFISQIGTLLANGVPIGGIGCQGHLASRYRSPMSPELVQRMLDRLARFDLPIKITECLFDADTEENRARELRNIFPVYFAHPGVEAIVMWGFWEGTAWQPQTALWRKDWTPTPQGLAYRDLVFGEWWTETSGKADRDGMFRTAAFYGDYRITVNGETQNVTLSKKDRSARVIVQ